MNDEGLDIRVREEALRALPHGPGFRFVDEVTMLDPGRRGTGTYEPPVDAGFFAAHFPGDPLVPGVLLVEAVAQLGGVVAQADPVVPPMRGLKLAGIRSARVSGTARPGEVVVLNVEVIGRMGGLIQVRGTAEVTGREILRCEVTLAGQVDA